MLSLLCLDCQAGSTGAGDWCHANPCVGGLDSIGQFEVSRFFWKAAIVQTAMVTSVKTRLNENDVFHKRSSVNSPRLLLLLSMLCRVPQEIQPRFWPIGTRF